MVSKLGSKSPKSVNFVRRNCKKKDLFSIFSFTSIYMASDLELSDSVGWTYFFKIFVSLVLKMFHNTHFSQWIFQNSQSIARCGAFSRSLLWKSRCSRKWLKMNKMFQNVQQWFPLWIKRMQFEKWRTPKNSPEWINCENWMTADFPIVMDECPTSGKTFEAIEKASFYCAAYRLIAANSVNCYSFDSFRSNLYVPTKMFFV